MDESTSFAAVEYPHGIASARVDEKGRLKLPAHFHKYLTEIGANKVFVTSFDERIGRIYPTAVWNQVVAKLSTPGDETEEGEDLLFLANDIGDDAEIDSQGRFLVPAKMRKAMGFESQAVYLEHQKGHIKLFGSEVYEERRQRAIEKRAEKLKAFERKGLL